MVPCLKSISKTLTARKSKPSSPSIPALGAEYAQDNKRSAVCPKALSRLISSLGKKFHSTASGHFNTI